MQNIELHDLCQPFAASGEGPPCEDVLHFFADPGCGEKSVECGGVSVKGARRREDR